MSRKIAFLWPTPICLKINALVGNFTYTRIITYRFTEEKVCYFLSNIPLTISKLFILIRLHSLYAPNLLSIVSSMFFVSEVTFLSVLLPRNVCTVSLVSVSNLGFYEKKYHQQNIIIISYYVILLILILIWSYTKNWDWVIRP